MKIEFELTEPESTALVAGLVSDTVYINMILEEDSSSEGEKLPEKERQIYELMNSAYHKILEAVQQNKDSDDEQ